MGNICLLLLSNASWEETLKAGGVHVIFEGKEGCMADRTGGADECWQWFDSKEEVIIMKRFQFSPNPIAKMWH